MIRKEKLKIKKTKHNIKMNKHKLFNFYNNYKRTWVILIEIDFHFKLVNNKIKYINNFNMYSNK